MVVHRFEITVCYVLRICFGSDEADSNSNSKNENEREMSQGVHVFPWKVLEPGDDNSESINTLKVYCP